MIEIGPGLNAGFDQGFDISLSLTYLTLSDDRAEYARFSSASYAWILFLSTLRFKDGRRQPKVPYLASASQQYDVPRPSRSLRSFVCTGDAGGPPYYIIIISIYAYEHDANHNLVHVVVQVKV